MDKVYLVWYYFYESSCVKGVFTDLEKAKGLLAKLNKEDTWYGSYGIEVHKLNEEDEGDYYR